MKLYSFLLLGLFLCALNVRADPTPFSTNVNAMWLSGNKSGVLAIANQRLQSNPNDIAGLLLKLQYQIAFFDVADFPGSADKVIAAGASISTTNFVKVYPALKSNLQYLRQNMPSFSAAQIQSESAKGNISGKPMDFLAVLQAIEQDGLIQ